MSETSVEKRWDPYMLAQGEDFAPFWSNHLRGRDRKILALIGRGFDPRALTAIKQIILAGAKIDVWLLAFENGFAESDLRKSLTDQNTRELRSLKGVQTISELPIRIGGSPQGSATSTKTRFALKNAGPVTGYTDVIIDISAMPRMVALTSITQMLHDLDAMAKSGEAQINLHVTAAESVATDIGAAGGTLSEEVTSVAGFSGALGGVTTAQIPRVWFPVLGERQSIRLNRIKDYLNPDEICPVIPFPSRCSRRGDDIIKEHRKILFDDFQIEPKNILRASEYNPFEAYKQIYDAMARYEESLSVLGGCKAYVSPLSSKLLSVGPLLACYEHRFLRPSGSFLKVGIPYVETADYADPIVDEGDVFELSSMWIRGEWEI